MEPSVQGKGIGTRALQLALAESDATGHPVLLTTNEERSLVRCTNNFWEGLLSLGVLEAGCGTVDRHHPWLGWFRIQPPSIFLEWAGKTWLVVSNIC